MLKNSKNLVSRFLKDESGAVMVEYVVVVTVVAVAAIALFTGLTTEIGNRITNITTQLNGAG